MDQGTLFAVGFLLAAVAGVGAVWLVRHTMARPTRVATDALRRIAEGDLTTRVPDTGTAEMKSLARAVNRLAVDLDARIDDVRRGRHELELILASMEEGVVLVDDEGAVRFANPSARRMLDGVPRSIRELVPAPIRTLVEEARAEEAPRVREVEHGAPRRVTRASAIPLGGPGGILIVLRDVTQARRIEAIRRDFVADASHELKTPAASIRAAAETLERAIHDDPGAAASFATRLRKDAVRLSRIVSDLLDLSRLESERPAMEPVRLDRLVAEEVGRIESDAREAGIAMDVDAQPVTVRGAPKDLALLARNLLDNAVRYTPQGGRVRVEVGGDNGGARLAVSDTGIGIPSRDLPRIFERFYRVDRARSRDTGGTGLGLSIARHVAEQHGGRVEAESELGSGSTFRVTLPTNGD